MSVYTVGIEQSLITNGGNNIMIDIGPNLLELIHSLNWENIAVIIIVLVVITRRN